MAKALFIWSHTHHGRGDPLTGAEVKSNIRLARHLLDLFAPGLPTYGTYDEDYGWFVPLSDEQIRALMERYPKSWEECGSIYLTDGSSRYDDMMTIEFEGTNHEVAVPISNIDQYDLDRMTVPVDRDKLWLDWYDHYGRY